MYGDTFIGDMPFSGYDDSPLSGVRISVGNSLIAIAYHAKRGTATGAMTAVQLKQSLVTLLEKSRKTEEAKGSRYSNAAAISNLLRMVEALDLAAPELDPIYQLIHFTPPKQETPGWRRNQGVSSLSPQPAPIGAAHDRFRRHSRRFD